MTATPLTADLVIGAAELERTARGLRPHRLPRPIRERFADPQLSLMEAQPSGVRIAVSTTARRLSLELLSTRVAYRGLPRARGVVDVTVDGAAHSSHALTRGDAIELNMQTGASTMTSGDPDLVVIDGLEAGEKTIEIWLPHNEQVDVVALHTDAPVRPAQRTGPVWLHHGSSISHGSNATSPTGIWPAVAARRAHAQLHNLGFGGSALVDPFMARHMRDAKADLISAKLGINVINHDSMRLRSFVPAVHGFLDTIRDGHPETPLLLISPIFCGIHENTPGPGAIDPAALGSGVMRFVATGTEGDTAGGRLTLRVVRRALEEIVAARSDDPNLHHLDGLELYGEHDASALPLPDGLHPDTATHALIGKRFAEIAFGAGGPFDARAAGTQSG
ncbi:GDSL-like lipase/acylhydrolase family protein [Humibacillus xanthopallidus]|uniref:GDSL-like lipase/acylhydrolase family protein n=2 Tax=Humibacillus xanthopallidus TaxID=412689 RepID=A0A543PVT5_9MICO|nr:GDSL-like lipase/acylhydrolase family protein [Humibacillus xanthopallidus]